MKRISVLTPSASTQAALKPSALILAAFVMLLGAGCASAPGGLKTSWQGWKKAGRAGTLRIADVRVDRIGDRDSVANEIRDMAPLFFLEKGFALGENADYAAEIRAREREYNASASGWKTKRSLSLEVRIWPGDAGEGALPLAAARVLMIGDKTFSSSATISVMLKAALGRAVRKLPRKGKP